MAHDASISDGALSFNIMIHMLNIRLTPSNFILWRRQLLPLLQGQALYGHIDGSTPAPPAMLTSVDGSLSSTVNPAFTFGKQQDQRLVSLLLASLTEETLAEVLHCETSQQIWTTLESLFGGDSKQWEIVIRDQLLHLKNDLSSVRDFSKSFCALCDQLILMGKPVDDLDKLHWFLGGLGPTFTSFGASQLAMLPLPTFRDLVSAAESFEFYINAMEVVSSQASFYSTTHCPSHPSHPHSSSGDRSSSGSHAPLSGRKGRGRGGRGRGNRPIYC